MRGRGTSSLPSWQTISSKNHQVPLTCPLAHATGMSRQFDIAAQSEVFDCANDEELLMKKLTCTVEALQGDTDTLMVRIPHKVVRQAGLHVGQPISVEVISGGLLIRTTLRPSPRLAQMLEAFDPLLHGGEAMATGLRGKELL